MTTAEGHDVALAAHADATEHRTFCRICPALCGLIVRTVEATVVEVRGDPDHPVTRGYTCPKGRAAGDLHHHPGRLDGPRLAGTDASWATVLDDLASRLRAAIDAHGPDAIAVYFGTWSWMDAPGRWAADALVRAIGTASRYSAITVDAIARLTVAELVGGTPALLPALDTDRPGLTVLVGTNPAVSHGHAGALADPVTVLRRVAAGPGLWVLDPRRTETARLATSHLAVRPGTDHVLLAHLVRELLHDGADHAYLEHRAIGVDALRAAVSPFTRTVAAERTGLDPQDLDDLLTAVRAARRVTVLTGTGVTMAEHAALTEWLAWSLQIITGSFETEGGAWFNPGAISRADLTTRRPRDEHAPAAPSHAPSRPDLAARFGERPCAALADEIEAGNVRALLVIGGDPLTSLPDTNRLRAAFERLDVLAVADVVDTDTVRAATHVLAVAGQLERPDATWYTDRFAPVLCAQRTDAVLAAVAERRLLDDVIADLAARLDLAPARAFWPTLEGRLPALAQSGAVVHDPARVRGWVHDTVLPGGRWNVGPHVLVELLAADGPPSAGATGALAALPRRTMRRMNSVLHDVRRGGEDTDVWVHPDDAIGLCDGGRAVLARADGRAEIEVTVRITDDIIRGAVAVPHGLRDQNVNVLTSGSPGGVDPFTGMVTQSGMAVVLRAAST